MAYLNGQYFSETGDALVDMMTHGYVWDTGTEGRIDWSISDSPSIIWADPAGIIAAYSQLFAEIDQYVAVDFVFSGHYDDADDAYAYGSDVNIAFDDGDYVSWFPYEPSTFAIGNFPEPGDMRAGDIFLNAYSPMADIDLTTRGGLGYFVVMHEIGHTIGLKHPHDDGGTGRPTFYELGLDYLDDTLFTVMSYDFSYGDDGRGTGQSNPGTMMVLDVLALQYLYGADMSTNAGNTFHVIESDLVYETIWDASGTDTLDAREAEEGWSISLPDTTFSDLVDTMVGAALPIEDLLSERPSDFLWLLGDIENVYGSQFADLISGNALDNLLKGNGGRDELYGNSGDDIINGGDDADVIDGGEGFDILAGGAGWDVITGGYGEDLLLGHGGADILGGGVGGDRINGGAGGDTINGQLGNDIINGASGRDWINGGIGQDLINGGADRDVVDGGGGHDNVRGGAGHDIVSGGNGWDTVRGNIGNDQLDGGNGNDFLKGDGGFDRLTGGLGIDRMMGGAQADKFVFTSTTESRANAASADRILDFEAGDKIDLHLIDASSLRGGNNKFVFSGTDKIGSESYGEVVYRQVDLAGEDKDFTMVYIDTDNDKGAEMAIYLSGLVDLTASDFIL
ncbi:M10 family metallopeptidase C-terminal domain-containing protein [Pseudoroseicyclus sp. CXY001]|uniref:M10 family metallopeptidase C-terminal domain-containing protein n=1 Tax=Pseudoroseicyclus sp. CXY001 TaxID=3242492 RepID=UPI00358DCF7D